MIPILAYHEVSGCNERDKQLRTMEPSCSIDAELFSRHAAFLQSKNFESIISFDEVLFIRTSRAIQRNKVIITFDDGHIGNYLFAFPILKKHKFNAIFFVTINFIESKDMMTWEQLREMSDNGMSVQSHCVSHAPLETLSAKNLKSELGLSKNIIENKIGKEVTTLSLPHGSLHPRLIEEARGLGYKYICTSKIDYYNPEDFEDIKLIPRIPIPDNITMAEFNEVVSGQGRIVQIWGRKQIIKALIKKLIGINNYRKIYRFIYSIERRA